MDHLPKEVAVVSKMDLESFKSRQRVGSYLLGETIGEGSFAKVKIAIHVATGEKVAIKIINKKSAKEDRYVSRNLKREAEIMQLLSHENIVRLLEVMETEAYYYLVTELCSGGELLDKICEKTYFDEDTTRTYIQQLVSAVSCIHRAGVVHRDLKIENFLLDEDDNLKIIDFGLSNVLSESAMEKWNQTGMCPMLLTTHCGSPAYAAPELLAQEAYGAQIDVWSIGVNMFAMLTGNLPYTMEHFNIIDLYHKMMQRKIAPFPKHVSPGARDLILRLLEPIPEKRITLQQAANHPWLKSSADPAVARVEPAEMNDYQINKDIVLHIAENMGLNKVDIVTSVKHNRASHTFAIYFLLKKRLKRFQEAKKDSRNCQDFSLSKIKFVKKAKLSSDRIFSTRSKFTYKGVKIKTNSTSHPRLHDDNTGFLILEKTYVESPEEKSCGEHWNQFATFPRDRRTTNSKENQDIVTIGNASLDRGSDDIDFHRVSSPESTDTSASSLSCPRIVRYKLYHPKGTTASFKALSINGHAHSSSESGSEDEFCNQVRSKSLTSCQEYEHSRDLFSTIQKSRTCSMASSSHKNFIETSPRTSWRQSHNLNRCSVSPVTQITPNNSGIQAGIPKNDDSKNNTPAQIRDELEQESKSSSLEEICRNLSKKLYIVECKEDEQERKDQNEFKRDKSNHGVSRLRKSSTFDCSSYFSQDVASEGVALRENLSTQTLSKDEKSTIEVLDSNNRQLANEKTESKVTLGKPKSKKSGRRRNQGRNKESSKSLSDINTVEAEKGSLRNIEVERVRRIELSPLKNPSIHMAPATKTISPFSLACANQMSPCPLEASSQHQLNDLGVPEEALERTNNGSSEMKRFNSADQQFKVDVVKLAKWRSVLTTAPESIKSSSELMQGAGYKRDGNADLNKLRPKQLMCRRVKSFSTFDYTGRLAENGSLRNDVLSSRVKLRASSKTTAIRKPLTLSGSNLSFGTNLSP